MALLQKKNKMQRLQKNVAPPKKSLVAAPRGAVYADGQWHHSGALSVFEYTISLIVSTFHKRWAFYFYEALCNAHLPPTIGFSIVISIFILFSFHDVTCILEHFTSL